MTVGEARGFVVKVSLIGTASTFLFFIVGKPLGYPLSWPQVQRVIEIVVPVFLGYLGAASHFVFSSHSTDDHVALGANEGLADLILKGATAAFGVVLAGILFAFGFTNRPAAAQDQGMSIDQLSWALASVLGILNVSTNVAVSYLFSVRTRRAGRAGAVNRI